MPIQNNVTRMLDAKKIVYTVHEMSTEKHSALQTAAILGVDPGKVFKTIVILREKPKKPILAVIPGDREVDLKALANFVGEKKVHLPTQREAETLTGLQSGGISPLALINKGFQVYLDQAASHYDQIHVSGGQRGLNICLAVRDLITLTNARMGTFSRLSETISDD